ncbi:MAG: lactonase family protein [Bacteroidota bacterium]
MIKHLFIFLFLVVSYATLAQNIPNKNILHFYVGTYTDSGSEGIYRFGLDTQSGKLHSNGLAVLSENPSYLAMSKDGRNLLAVRETKDESNHSQGYIELFKIDETGNLTSVNKVSSGGAHPCYVSVNEDGLVLASNYTGGNVALMRIEPTGELSEVLSADQHTGHGPVADRQEKPHVHSAIFEPKGKRIFVADLGIDQVKVYTIDKTTTTLKPNKYPEIKLPPGSGPRHMAIHPNGKLLFIANEIGCNVSVVQLLDNGAFKIVETVSTLPANFAKPNTCADIHLSPEGNFLYVSNRGMNSIAIFSVNEKEQKLKLLGHEDTKGEMPRNFTLTPQGDFLLVANQNTDNIVAFRRNAETGLLTYTDQINAFKPVCLLFK